MQINFVCPYWGKEGTLASDFLRSVLQEDYDGVEINMPDEPDFINEFQVELDYVRKTNDRFIFIAQQVLPLRPESVSDYINRLKRRLVNLVELKPNFINSHTGKDYFSVDDNCRIIELVENISQKSGVPILHETHRGRFTFHAASLLPYLDRFPKLRLTADFSHWCTVSESLLDDQQEILEKVIPFVHHLHARVGYEHSPQVNDPFAPEWKSTFDTFVGWWKKVIKAGNVTEDFFTICPEFGPAPYMPTMPFTQKPLGDQWKINVRIKDYLQHEFDSRY
ncbi:MAG: sugar phosphate isomerase/epimerase [Cyclobacteriaceae bacterium]|nr:sugar phosphate isomerase/epimerase [Cyclobacteriaceae bacterium]